MESTVQKSLDRKLAEIHADPSGSDAFIIADAKDADMAFGVGAPGLSPERHDGENRFKTLAEYRQQIREVIAQGIVDIVLMSASTSEKLTIEERLFDTSHVTPAARANDTTDVHVPRGGRTHLEPTRPFRSASIDHMQCGRLDCDPAERRLGVDLALYSLTFNNDRDLDLEAINGYKTFREEAERKGFRHFLEVFDPNQSDVVDPDKLPQFINDLIVRTLAGVTQAGRPVFLKIVYHGPAAMEELVRYDPHLVVGVLGGSAGTTLDAFQLIHDVKKYGGRAALFGRKINNAEHQLAFIEFLKLIIDGHLTPTDAVKAYHAVLDRMGIPPHRSLEEDLTYQTAVMSYGGSGKTFSFPGKPSAESGNETPTANDSDETSSEAPNFAAMSSEERLAYHRQRLNQMFGG